MATWSPDALDLVHIGVEIHRQLVAEALMAAARTSGSLDDADAPTLAEEADAHAEAAQRLAELEPDHAAAEDGDRSRQVVPVEEVVAGRQAVARGVEVVRADRWSSPWR